LDPARQGHCSIVGEHVAIERVQSGVADIGDEHTVFEVIEYHDPRTAMAIWQDLVADLGFPGVGA
jgi:hypothetical protein